MTSADRKSTQLAVDGGTPLCAEGPPPWPVPDERVWAALERSYHDGSWGQYAGPNCAALQVALRTLTGVEQVSLCCSGTIAVELALRGLQVGPGDEVLLAGYDFPGNFRAITACGALPVLVDLVAGGVVVDREQLAAARGPTTKAIIVSHLHGHVAPLDVIVPWAHEHGIAVVEDACQAPGGTLAGRPVGAWGDVATLSFGGSKLLTAGRGGAVLTNRAEIAQRIKIHCEQGNHAFPLSELQAAVLVPQVQQLPQRHAQRRRAVQRLSVALADVAGLRPLVDLQPTHDPAYYKLALWYDSAVLAARSREAFVAAVEAEGVASGLGFRGFAQRGASRCRKVGDLTHSRAAAERIVLLHHPVLLADDGTLDRVAQAVRRVAEASGS